MKDGGWRLCDLEQRLESDNDGGRGEDTRGEAGESPRDLALADEADDAGPGLGGHRKLGPELADMLNR